MPLPFIFANAVTVTTPQLDANFAALGALVPVPCTASGSNSLTLTALAGAPGTAGYSDYQPFTFIAVATNTTASSARLGSLPGLVIYKDTLDGAVALTGGEMIAGNAITLIFDAALNGGSGGFHLQTSIATGTYLPLEGGNLSGPLTGTTAAFSGAVIGGSLEIGLGATITRQLSIATTLTWTALAPGASQDQTIGLTGAAISDIVTVGLPATVTAGIVFDGRVSAANVTSVRATNVTAGTLTPSGGTYRVGVQGFS